MPSRLLAFKHILPIFLIVLSVAKAHAQNASSRRPEIDSLITIVDTLGRGQKNLAPLASRIITASEKANYAKGKAYGNVKMALALYFVNDYKKSVSFLEKAQQEKKYLKKNPALVSEIHYLYGDNYQLMGLLPLARREYLKALQWAKKETHDIALKERRIQRTYLGLISMYMITEKPDSIRHYTDELKNTPLEHMDSKSAFVDVMYGKYHVLEGHLDSASYYYAKGYDYFKNTHQPYRDVALFGLGQVAYQKKNYQQALAYDRQALRVPIVEIRIVILRHIAEVYSRLGDAEKEQEYRHRYRAVQDSLVTAHKTQRATLLNNVLKNIDAKYTQETQNVTFEGGIIILLLLGTAGGIILFFYRKNRTHKEELGVKERILSQKEQEAQLLQQKVNAAFEEVIQLAKENDPAFFARFREVYPNIYQKIDTTVPALTNAEREFCAMLWIGFSTKDIARYTHIQPKSVHMKKYRLRKKMGLSKGQNIQEWINDLSDDSTVSAPSDLPS